MFSLMRCVLVGFANTQVIIINVCETNSLWQCQLLAQSGKKDGVCGTYHSRSFLPIRSAPSRLET